MCAAGDVAVTYNNPLPKYGAVFDGVDDKITGDSPADYTLGISGDLSLSAWFKCNGLTGITQYIVSKYAFNIFINNANQKLCYEGRNAGSTAWESLFTADAINLGQWYHVCVVHSSADQKMYIYVDGVLSNSQAKTDGTHGALTAYFPRIGSYAVGAGGQWFKGIINKVGWYNVALTAAEVANLAAGKDVTRGRISFMDLQSNYTDTENKVIWTNSGSSISAQDGILDRDLRTKRTNANEKYYLFAHRGKVFSASIDEA